MLRDVTGSEEDVAALFDPASIAILGASSRPGALSWWPLQLLRNGCYRGQIWVVNPTHSEIEGTRCYASVGDLPGTPDLAMVTLNADRTLDAVRQCAAAGVRTVVLPTQGFGETSAAGRTKEEELIDLAAQTGLRIVGTNTDGIANIASGAIASIQPLFGEGVLGGPVGITTQSGATAASLMARLKRDGIGCRYYASAGNETDLGLADYMSFMLQSPDVRMVLSFVESIRRPEAFSRVAELAAELAKPIVLIKVGRSAQGARRAAAHTGALTGEDAVYDTVFRELGVIRVDELSELVAVAKVYLSGGAPRFARVGVMSVSGGQAGAIADKLTGRGVAVPQLSPGLQSRLDGLLEFGSGFNPCDLTGAVATNHELASKVFSIYAQDGFDTVLYARKALTGVAGIDAARHLVAAAAQSSTSVLVYAMDGVVDGEEAAILGEAEIPVFDSVNDISTAISALAGWGHPDQPLAVAVPDTDAAREPRAGDDEVLDDAEVKAVLREHGIPLVAEALVKDRDAAVAAAERFGYPVVLKVADSRVPHKTEAGGVVTGVASAHEVRAAFDTVAANVRRYLDTDDAPEGVLVQEQVGEGTELILGITVDPGFGPLVVVGLGGVFTELLSDVTMRRAPVDVATALTMLGELRGAQLLRGFRGGPPADLAAAAEAIAALSRLAVTLGPSLREIDINPLIVLDQGRGTRAVDALIVTGAPAVRG